MVENFITEKEQIIIKKRAGNPTWKKGVCPNPGGRPKDEVNITKLARDNSIEALQYLIDTFKNNKVNVKFRIMAAVHVIERGYGKPPQEIKGAGDGGEIIIKVEKEDDFANHLQAPRFAIPDIQ